MHDFSQDFQILQHEKKTTNKQIMQMCYPFQPSFGIIASSSSNINKNNHSIQYPGKEENIKKQVKIPLTSAASRSEEEAPRRSTSKCILTQPSSSTCWQVQDGLLATRQLSTATGEGIYLAQDKGIRKTFSTLFQAHKLYTDILCLGTTSTIPTDHSYDLLYRCRALARYIMLP